MTRSFFGGTSGLTTTLHEGTHLDLLSLSPWTDSCLDPLNPPVYFGSNSKHANRKSRSADRFGGIAAQFARKNQHGADKWNAVQKLINMSCFCQNVWKRCRGGETGAGGPWSSTTLGKKKKSFTTLRSQSLVHDLIVVEVSSPTVKMVPVQSHNSFLDQRFRKVIV